MSFTFRPSLGRATTLCAAALAVICLSIAPAAAQDLYEDDWAFNLFNDSSIGIQAFQTQEMNGAFSTNWLYEPMYPGFGLTMEFNDRSDTRCEILTRVVFVNGATLDGYVNYCSTAIVNVTNEGMFYE